MRMHDLLLISAGPLAEEENSLGVDVVLQDAKHLRTHARVVAVLPVPTVCNLHARVGARYLDIGRQHPGNGALDLCLLLWGWHHTVQKSAESIHACAAGMSCGLS